MHFSVCNASMSIHYQYELRLGDTLSFPSNIAVGNIFLQRGTGILYLRQVKVIQSEIYIDDNDYNRKYSCLIKITTSALTWEWELPAGWEKMFCAH